MGKLKNHRHELVCQLFVFGNPKRPPSWAEDELTAEELAELPPQTEGSRTQSYIQAGYRARGQSAWSASSALFRRRDIRDRINELRDELHEVSSIERFRWSQMVPLAQRALVRVLKNSESDAAVVAACKELLAQADGPVGIRFKNLKPGDEATAIPVVVLGYSDRDEPPASFEEREPDDTPDDS